jgi:uncharacterized protein YndB with AHSA1/START domain
MYAIKHLFHINAKKADVYKALATLAGLRQWWTKDVTGNEHMGGLLQFNFGTHVGPQMQVAELVHDEKVSWECTASEFGWKGHMFTFTLDENDGKTRVRFSHMGWQAQDDNYAACCFSWGRYMESLRQLCQTGKGEGFGSEGYRK